MKTFLAITATWMACSAQAVLHFSSSINYPAGNLGTVGASDGWSGSNSGVTVEEAAVDGFFGRPSHPYTRKLLDSLPTSEAGIRGIPGEIPRLIDPPPGCRFHPRCERASALCRAERPAPERIGPAHSVRCHHRIGAAEPAG